MAKGQENHEPLDQRVSDFVNQHQLLLGRQQLIVAVSGGPDSVCLFHILFKLRDDLNVQLHVAHLDHCLRGADSEADARYVQQLAQRFGVPATIERHDVKVYKSRKSISLEEAAREVRYDFLAQVAESVGTDSVAVGHTSDDQVETILLHLIRGTGTRGLRGLQPSSPWRSDGNTFIIRPLLTISRQETVEYCRLNSLEPRIDASNLSLFSLRNRVRHQLLPLLNSYNPQIAEALLRTAHLAGDDLDFLESEIKRLWGGVARRDKDTIVISKEAFLDLHPALQRNLLRMAIKELLGDIRDIEAYHIEEIRSALYKPAGKGLDLPRGLVFTVEYDRYLLGFDKVVLSPFPPLNDELRLTIPGETLLPGWRIVSTIIEYKLIPEEERDF